MLQSPLKAAPQGRSGAVTENSEDIGVVKQRLERTVNRAEGDEEQRTVGEGKSTDQQEALAVEHRLPAPSVLRLVLRNPGTSSSAKTVEDGDILEVYDENESGLSWGRRKAKDNSWEEQWLQQAQHNVVSDGGTATEVEEMLREDCVFGRSSGVNSSLQQRWTSTWQNRLRSDGKYKKTVKKICQRYEADMKTIIEEWTEYIVETSTDDSSALDSGNVERENTEPSSLSKATVEGTSIVPVGSRSGPETATVARAVEIIKLGTDYRTGRQWRSEKLEKFDSQGASQMLEDHFEERLLGDAAADGSTESDTRREIRRSRHRQINGATDVERRDEVEQEAGVVCRAAFEQIERPPEGGCVGFQRSYIRGKRTVERSWTDRSDGSRETADCVLTEGVISGRKSHTEKDGTEIYGCRWEHGLEQKEVKGNETETQNSPVEVRRFWDEWKTDTKTNHRSGTKVAQVVSGPAEDIQRTSPSFLNDIDAQLSPSVALAPALLKHSERLLDIIREPRGELPSATFVKEDHEKWHDNDGTEVANDKWTICTTYSPQPEAPTASSSSEIIEAKKPCIAKLVESGSKTITRPSEGTEWGENWYRRSEPSVENTSELTLQTSHSDKWWKEPSGNKWGEKRTVDVVANSEQNEKWYNNCTEEVIDRWTIRADGTKEGFKRGRKLDNSEVWQEKWGGHPEAEGDPDTNYWIDKFWEKHEYDGATYKWGTINGREGAREWNESWRETAGSTGEKYVEKWNTDGCGNSKTTKEGVSWSNDEVTNWFSDQYGSCESSQETWAFKQGNNPVSGDAWVEKWNEFPNRKVAEKSGRNAQGDEWSEAWSQEWVGENLLKMAQKTGKNAQGCAWNEEWREEGDKKKSTRKSGSTPYEEWTEEWSEDFSSPDGSGCKWTNKWASKRVDGKTTSSHGQSWGEQWNQWSSHHWGDEWESDEAGNRVKDNKWNYDVPENI